MWDSIWWHCTSAGWFRNAHGGKGASTWQTQLASTNSLKQHVLSGSETQSEEIGHITFLDEKASSQMMSVLPKLRSATTLRHPYIFHNLIKMFDKLREWFNDGKSDWLAKIFFLFNFEIWIDSQEVTKIVQKGLEYLSPSVPSGGSRGKYGTPVETRKSGGNHGNREADHCTRQFPLSYRPNTELPGPLQGLNSQQIHRDKSPEEWSQPF